jgi:hypothetical protein
LTLTDNIVPAQRTAFVLPFPTSIIQTVNQTPVILNSLLQKLNIVKRLVDKSQEEKNRVATPRTNRITPYTQPPRYVKTAKTCVSLRELWDLSLRYWVLYQEYERCVIWWLPIRVFHSFVGEMVNWRLSWSILHITRSSNSSAFSTSTKASPWCRLQPSDWMTTRSSRAMKIALKMSS